MAEKGFAKAKDVERIGKKEMEALAAADAAAKFEGAKEKRAEKAYEDEFTLRKDDLQLPKELDEPDEPEVPEKKAVPETKPKASEVKAGEETARAIYTEAYQAGYIEGHKKARAEILERLVG